MKGAWHQGEGGFEVCHIDTTSDYQAFFRMTRCNRYFGQSRGVLCGYIYLF
jgi:hypothetical protein